jgi:hypothetical protein
MAGIKFCRVGLVNAPLVGVLHHAESWKYEHTAVKHVQQLRRIEVPPNLQSTAVWLLEDISRTGRSF